MIFLQVVFILVFPLVVLRFISMNTRTVLLSPILLCYLVGIIIANLTFIPINASLSMTMAEFAVHLAIPLVLFPTDILKCFQLAKSTLLSFGLIVISVMLSSALGAQIFASRIEEFWQVAGMLAGVYTGGTPNLMAVGLALDVSEQTIVLVNTADVVMGILYIFFLLILAKPLLSRFLPPFQTLENNLSASNEEIPVDSQQFFWTARPCREILLPLFLSLSIVGISFLLSIFFTGEIVMSFIILSITTLGILGSLAKGIRSLVVSYDIGQYLLLVFAIAIGTTINFRNMLLSDPAIFLYVAFVMIGAILLHFILSALFRIDVDTTIIISTAGIFGPSFIPPVAVALKNKEVIAMGLTLSLVGLALGNYLGMFLAYLLMP